MAYSILGRYGAPRGVNISFELLLAGVKSLVICFGSGVEGLRLDVGVCPLLPVEFLTAGSR